jgi:hypothetical protein
MTTFSEHTKLDRHLYITYSNGAVYHEAYPNSAYWDATVTKTDPTRRRKPSGWLYPNDYDLDKIVIHRQSGVNQWTGSSFNEVIQYVGTDPSNPLDSNVRAHNGISQSLIDRAVTKALLKLKDQKFNAAQALAEAQLTADLVGSTALRLGKAYRDLRKGNLGAAARDLGLGRGAQLPQSWLESQYAWKPLLSDVYGAMDKLTASNRFNDWVVTVKGVVREEFADSGILNSGSDWPCLRQQKGFDGCFVRLDYIPTNDVLAHISSLGLTNPLALVWEKTPYSFVVDWFLPIGDWFSVLDATLGYTYLSGSRTERQDTSATFTGLPRSASGTKPGSAFNTTRADAWRKTIRRRSYPSSPLPNLPRLKNPLSLGHMTNGLSLLTQAFGSR